MANGALSVGPRAPAGQSDRVLNWRDILKAYSFLTDEDVEDILGRIDDLVSWANDIKEFALAQAIGGKNWNGYKLVEGKSNRRYVNEEAVAEAVEQAGYDPYEKKLLGITAMQKLLGKTRFEEVLAGLVEKPAGKSHCAGE